MALFKNGAFIEDEWRFPTDEDAVPGDGPVVLGKERFLAERHALAGHNGPLGLLLKTGETLDGLDEHINHFSLIVLDIPKYNDGRAYSTARILRDRHGFRGELRAQGDVLRDQINALHRCGFDALEVTHPGTIEALRTGAVVFVHEHYQPASLQEGEDRPNPLRRRLRVTLGEA